MCAGDVSDVDRGGLEGAQTGVREAWLIGQFRVFEAVSPSCSGLYRSQACAERAYAMRTTGWCKKMDLNLPFPTVGTHRGLPCRNSPMCTGARDGGTRTALGTATRTLVSGRVPSRLVAVALRRGGDTQSYSVVHMQRNKPVQQDAENKGH